MCYSEATLKRTYMYMNFNQNSVCPKIGPKKWLLLPKCKTEKYSESIFLSIFHISEEYCFSLRLLKNYIIPVTGKCKELK